MKNRVCEKKKKKEEKKVPIANAVFFFYYVRAQTMYFYLVCSLRETGSLTDFFLPRNNNTIVPSTVDARL